MRYLHDIPQEKPKKKEIIFNMTFTGVNEFNAALERMRAAYNVVATEMREVTQVINNVATNLRATVTPR